MNEYEVVVTPHIVRVFHVTAESPERAMRAPKRARGRPRDPLRRTERTSALRGAPAGTQRGAGRRERA
jgi:hypothetical protein